MNLAQYRTAAKALLGSAADPALWSDSLLDAAARQALREYCDNGPAATAFGIIGADGWDVTMDALGGTIWRILGFAWPHEPARPLDAQLVPFRVAGECTVHVLGSNQPRAGERYGCIYRPIYTIQDLDGAATTTVWPAHEPLLTLGMAAWAVEIHYRQASDVSRGGGAPRDRGIVSWATARLREYRAGLDALGGNSLPQPCWGDMGV